jgi:hypothetical protein
LFLLQSSRAFDYFGSWRSLTKLITRERHVTGEIAMKIRGFFDRGTSHLLIAVTATIILFPGNTAFANLITYDFGGSITGLLQTKMVKTFLH